MRRSARRYWCGLLAGGLLIIPAYGAADIPEGWSASSSGPFLSTVAVLNRALHALSSAASAPAIRLPRMSDPKLTATQTSPVQPAPTTGVRGSAAALVAPPDPPAPQNAFVVVQDGQTVWEIAQSYGVPVDVIVENNGLSTGDLIYPGERLVIPGAATDIPRRVSLSRGLSSAITIARSFFWPARGRVTSGFGLRVHPIFGTREMHTGIDIGAPTGTLVYAARPGKVTFAAYESGYGRLVVIDHGDGVATWYSHLSVISVRVGQLVQSGEVVGHVGSTGYSTGPHLLFEIRVHGRPLDPLKYL